MITANGLIQLGFEVTTDFTLQNDGDGVYIKEGVSDKPKPTTADIEVAHAEWQSEYDAQEYARNRKAEYPSIDDLIVALWEAVVEERMAAVTSLEGKRQAVKTKYPK